MTRLNASCVSAPAHNLHRNGVGRDKEREIENHLPYLRPTNLAATYRAHQRRQPLLHLPIGALARGGYRAEIRACRGAAIRASAASEDSDMTDETIKQLAETAARAIYDRGDFNVSFEECPSSQADTEAIAAVFTPAICEDNATQVAAALRQAADLCDQSKWNLPLTTNMLRDAILTLIPDPSALDRRKP
jgi:hypothetical protein